MRVTLIHKIKEDKGGAGIRMADNTIRYLQHPEEIKKGRIITNAMFSLDFNYLLHHHIYELSGYVYVEITGAPT